MTVPFSEWFPLPVGLDTLLMFGVTVLLVMAGSVVGIVIKELEIYDPKKNPRPSLLSVENKMFLALGAAVSVGFWIANIPAVDCFFYSTALKAGLGTLRNVVDRKRNGAPTLEQLKKDIAKYEAKKE